MTSFADRIGENERMRHVAERGEHLADPGAKAVDENVEREMRAVVAALSSGNQNPDVAVEAGEAFQSALLVEHLFQFIRARALSQQIEQDTRIDRAGARAHRQPIEGQMLELEEFAIEHNCRLIGFGQRETSGASRSLVSAPAGISATKKHSVFIGRLGPSSLQVRRC